MAEPRKIKLLLNDDVIYQILLWLHVVSLLQFKRVCRSWRTLIESSNFIKQHLHRHHYDPGLKDKNRNIICLLPGKMSSITFPLTSIEGFEEPNVFVQLNGSDLHGFFPVQVLEIVSYDGIICLNLLNCKGEQSICLWNPATKQSKVLPQSSFLNNIPFSIGFGFDIKSKDYKVVKLMDGGTFANMIFEVYSLNTSSWKSQTTAFPSGYIYDNPRMPFNKGTCFFWGKHSSSGNKGVFCYEFSSELFRSISFPCVDCHRLCRRMNVVDDKIACVLRTTDDLVQLWVFNEYGTVNESWTKLYTIGTNFGSWGWSVEGVSMNGNYIFIVRMDQMCRFNVVTKETNCFTLRDGHYSFGKTLVGFKESLVWVEEGNKCTYLR